MRTYHDPAPVGRVLLARAYDGKAGLDTSELYDPKRETFSLSGSGG